MTNKKGKVVDPAISAAARALSKLGAKVRFENTTPEQRSAHCRMMAMAKIAKTTHEERSEAARKCTQARWDRSTPEERAAHGQRISKALQAKSRAAREAKAEEQNSENN